MQEDLPRLARKLRNERCPRRVIDAAVRRIAAETPPASRLHYAVPATLVLAGVVLLCSMLVRSHLTGDNAGQQRQWVEQQTQRRIQVARQAETALGLIGSVLLDAAPAIADRAGALGVAFGRAHGVTLRFYAPGTAPRGADHPVSRLPG